jgi:hypothetical protein
VDSFPGIKNTPIPALYAKAALTGVDQYVGEVKYKDDRLAEVRFLCSFSFSPSNRYTNFA